MQLAFFVGRYWVYGYKLAAFSKRHVMEAVSPNRRFDGYSIPSYALTVGQWVMMMNRERLVYDYGLCKDMSMMGCFTISRLFPVVAEPHVTHEIKKVVLL